jgi:hypothetical protein
VDGRSSLVAWTYSNITNNQSSYRKGEFNRNYLGILLPFKSINSISTSPILVRFWQFISKNRQDIILLDHRLENPILIAVVAHSGAMILDEQRTLHEEVERLEQAIAERVIEEPNHVSPASV